MLKKMRIAKFIANAGFCSRREAEKLIEDKIVKINNHLCLHPSETVDDSDKVTIGQKIIEKKNIFNNTLEINIGSLSQGLYVTELTFENGTKMLTKLIKK